MFDFNDADKQPQDKPKAQARPQVDPVSAFSAAMSNERYKSGPIVADGEIQRFDIDKRGDKIGWYWLALDGCPAGAFGDWKSGDGRKWSAINQRDMTPAELADVNRKYEAAKVAREAEKARRNEAARIKAARIWDQGQPAPADFPYLVSKKIQSYDLKISPQGQLMVPMFDAAGALWSLQFINPDGSKRFLPDGAIKGNFHTIPGDDKVFICEGFATGATIADATGGTVIVAFNSGNLKRVAKTIKLIQPGKDIVICADNDQWTTKPDGTPYNPGVEAAAKIGARVVVPTFEEVGTRPTDFNDLAAAEGPQAVKGQIFEQLEKQPVRTARSFKFIHNSDVQLKSPEWLIDGAIEKDALALVFGDPESAKSFWAMDIACSVATGKDFHGHKVKQGPSHYIAGEGFNGLKRRLTAWQIYHGINVEKAPLFMSLTAASLSDKEQSEVVTSAINETVAEYGPPALVVIDTVARNFGPGDENSTKDMTAFIGAVDNIRYATGNPTILLVHHTGHADKSRARGAMALKGALDAEYRLVKNARTNVVTVEATKMKDAEPPKPAAFELHSVALGLKDESGRDVTSAVLHSVNYEDAIKKSAKNTSPNMERAMSLLRNLYAEYEKNVAKSGRKGDPPSVSKKDFWEACKAQKVYNRRDAFNNALMGLVERNYLTFDDNNNFVYPIEIFNKYYNPVNQV